MVGIELADVERLLNELQSEKIILKYRAIINWEQIESNEVAALIQVSVQTEKDSGYDEVAARIARMDEVTTCLLVSGSFDLLVEVNGPSLKEVAFFVADKLATIEGVTHTRTNFLLKRYKQAGDLLTIKGKNKTLAYGHLTRTRVVLNYGRTKENCCHSKSQFIDQ